MVFITFFYGNIKANNSWTTKMYIGIILLKHNSLNIHFGINHFHYTIVTSRQNFIIHQIKCLFYGRTNITLIYQLIVLNFFSSQSAVMSSAIKYNETLFYRPTLFPFAVNTQVQLYASILALLKHTLRMCLSCAHVTDI